jgi:hypothetical protein
VTMPATVGELLGLAEDAATNLSEHLLRSTHLQTRPLLRAWPAFRTRSLQALRITIGPRVPNHPVDAAVFACTRGQLRPVATAPTREPPAVDALLRISELLGAAGDLIAQADVSADAAHALATRIASTVASVAYCVSVTAGRHGYSRSHNLAEVVRLHAAASKVIDAHADLSGRSTAEGIAAEPTTVTYGPGSRLAAAALRLRREAMTAEPSSEVFILTAVTSGRLVVTAWRLLDAAQRAGAAIEPSPGAISKDTFREAAQAWREIARTWRTHFVPGRRPEAVRTAAAELNAAGDALARAIVQQPAPSRNALLDAVSGATRGLEQVRVLAEQQGSLTQRLARSGRVFVSARSLPPTPERLCDVARNALVAAPRGVAPAFGQLYLTAESRTGVTTLHHSPSARSALSTHGQATPAPTSSRGAGLLTKPMAHRA